MSEPKNLDITGRGLSTEEMTNLEQYFNRIDYLTETVSIVEDNIKAAKDVDAASTWVQLMLNVALQSFDNITREEE